MPTFPTDGVETRSHESNADVNSVGGTIIDADDTNWVYDMLETLQIKVGPDTDTSAASSVEGRLKALEEAAPPLVNPMTTLGDLIRGAADGDPERLAIGTAAQVLTVVAGVPAWADATGGFDDPLTTAGDLMIRDAANDPARLAIGSAGQFLGISAGLPAWTTPNYVPLPASLQQGDIFYVGAGTIVKRLGPGTTGQFLQTRGASTDPRWWDPPSSAPGDGITAPVGSAEGDLLVFTDPDWDNLTPGTSGTFLKSNGAGALPTWDTPAGGGDMTNPMTTLSDMIYADTGGTPLRLPIGVNGQILTTVAGAPAWASTSLVATPDYATINWSND